jgi:hypothetical protein
MLGQELTVRFNDIRVTATPDAEPQQLVRHYDNESRKRAKRKLDLA